MKMKCRRVECTMTTHLNETSKHSHGRAVTTLEHHLHVHHRPDVD